METVFLACFVFGVLFTIASVVLGFAGHDGVHFGGHDHSLPHLGHAHAGAHVGHAESGDRFPLLSGSSLIGALTWFGAAGFVLGKLGDLALPAVLLGAALAGAAGWYLIARFLGLVLKGEREMDPDDYRLEGTVGQITVSIPHDGTGEIVFSMAGARRSEAARALGGAAIPRGTEVVITSYADGFATVQPWGDFVAAPKPSVAALENKEA
jgi:membrane protein implicated in regulation of membrane protease activity